MKLIDALWRGKFFMGYIRGTHGVSRCCFPLALDDLVPSGRLCCVIYAFVGNAESG